MRKVLFLDFDGVLHPAQGNSMPDFVRSAELADALADAACEIVISSTWREHYSVEKLKGFLPEVVAQRVSGTLGLDVVGKHCRYQTIAAWLRSAGGDVNWRALDDSASEFPPSCPELIHCDGMTGFALSQAAVLRQWLES